MEPDFSGYATRNGLKCSDGRTIMTDAFKHSDQQRVPLVWQHQHNEPVNILGHALLENRKDGVYTYGFFNDSPSAQNAKTLVKHGDITALSIYANNLSQQGKNVLHGDIKEVSLVLSGANPGAFIDNINLQHGDTIETLDDEAIIYTGLEFEHSATETKKTTEEVLQTLDEEQREVVYSMIGDALEHSNTQDETTVQDVFDSFNEEQQEVVYGLISDALEHSNEGETVGNTMQHAAEDKTVKDVFDSMSEEQKNVVYFMIGEALEGAGDDGDDEDLQQSDNNKDILQHIDNSIQEGFNSMSRNVFENNGPVDSTERPTLTHSQLDAVVADAQKIGSFKEAIIQHAGTYGINDIDVLFPDAKTITSSPEVIGRRTEWVKSVLTNSKHSPFARIKSTAVDLTADEARAKGYVRGNLKKEEVIRLLKRVTIPTTVYKKQKLDRDDIVDITDLDVVSWLKAEMRVMLDEELARAILIGDGREPDDEDKIDEEKLRPIAHDNDMYAHQVTVPSNVAGDAVVESVLRARTFYKGTGRPTLYTTDGVLTDLILLKDKVGRRLYNTEAELAAALRVDKIVVAEVMESVPNILAIIVNIADYTIGADKGGQISMFDDFDIDYNQYKYLIETRISGALTKPKSAVVIRRTSGTVVTPLVPEFDGATNTITIPSVTGVEYYNVTDMTGEGTLMTAGPTVISETTDVEARPTAGNTFPHNTDTDWTFGYVA